MAALYNSLLADLSARCGARVSALHDMDRGQRKRLLEILLEAPPDTESLNEWNDMLYDLTGARPQRSVQAAHARLVILLSRSLHNPTNSIKEQKRFIQNLIGS